MSGASTAIMAAAAVAGAAISYQNGQESKKAAANALEQSKKTAAEQTKAAEEANNAANRKTPNTASILDQAQQAGKQGASGTMLTGSQGVDPNALNLGKNTLLGG